jgi:hypothetical protein
MPGGEHYLYPEPPLHHIIKRDGEVYDLSDEFKMIVDSSQAASINKFLKELANERK